MSDTSDNDHCKCIRKYDLWEDAAAQLIDVLFLSKADIITIQEIQLAVEGQRKIDSCDSGHYIRNASSVLALWSERDSGLECYRSSPLSNL